MAALEALALLLHDEFVLLRSRLARDQSIVCGFGRRGLCLSHSLACLAHVFDSALRADARRAGSSARDDRFRLQPFNLFEDGARAMISDHPVTGEGRRGNPQVIVVGLGWLCIPLVTELARSWREGEGLQRHGRLTATLVAPQARIADATAASPSVDRGGV